MTCMKGWTRMTDVNSLDLTKFQFLSVANVDEIEDGDRLFIEVQGQTIILMAAGDGYYAMGDVCTHDGGPLGDGELDGCELICPRHGARFDIRTGAALTLPAVVDAPVFPVRVVDRSIEVGIPLDD